MKKITIYGASDDLTAEYSKAGANAGWTIGVENSDTWPSWPMHYAERPDREGDPALIIEVPTGTIVKEIS